MDVGKNKTQAKPSILVAVGSRSDHVCSVGSFARAEAKALADGFATVQLLEPDRLGRYPHTEGFSRPDWILLHSPSLHDRKRPWNVLWSALKLRLAFPRARLVPVVHECSEAPLHWRLRQLAVLFISSGAVVNSKADHAFVSRWKRRLRRTPLGPTLFFNELLGARGDAETIAVIKSLKSVARKTASAKLGLDSGRKWVLHPGLLTPGKGIDFLARLAPVLDSNTQLIIMGGKGPKARDIVFAETVLTDLRARFGDRLSFIDAPDDELFREMLIASDLVVLPYDVGVSERRSSFLSAMSCGANVWTTTGVFSDALGIESTGVISVPAASVGEPDKETLRNALAEEEPQTLARRLKNVDWARGRSWSRRVAALQEFFNEFAK